MLRSVNCPWVRTFWVGGLLAGTLLLIGGWFYRDLGVYFDLDEADEGLYLYRGLRWSVGDEPLNREWGPLYSVWYAELSRWMPPERAYYVNAYIATLLPPLLLALWVYRQTGQAFWAWTVGLGYLVSWGNHNSWRVNHWLLLWVLFGWLLLPQAPHGLLHPRIWLAMAWMAWGLSFVRPETMLSALLFALGALLLLIFPRFSSARGLSLASWGKYGVLLVLFFAVAWRTHPWKNPQGRALGAFGQHFAVRWKARTQGDFNPYTDWPHVLQEQFGELRSIGDAFRQRPDLMAWFLGKNGLSLGRVVAQRITPYPWRYAWIPWSLAWFTVVLVLMALFWFRKPAYRKVFVLWMTFFILWALPFIVAAWLIYPRPHYFVVPLALGWGLLGYIAAYVIPLSRRAQWGGVIGGALLFLLFVPPAYSPQPRPLYHTVRWLRQALAPLSSPLVVYEAWHPAFLYLADRVRLHEMRTWTPGEPASWPDLFRASDVPQLKMDAQKSRATGYRYEPFTLPDGSLWWLRADLAAPSEGDHNVWP